MNRQARPSAALCLLRTRGSETQVFMVQRGAGARFMGGAWVFPGGAVDEIDHGDTAAAVLPGVAESDRPWLAAAVRELFEEAGVWLSDPPQTVPAPSRPSGVEVFRKMGASAPIAVDGVALFSNWVTPTAVPVRFDARFYVAQVRADTDGEPDGAEVDAVRWIAPAEAIAHSDAGEMLIPFPTRRTLIHFAALGSSAAIVAHARGNHGVVAAIQPRLRLAADGVVEAVLPDEPGYDALADDPPEAGLLAGAASVRAATGERIPELEPRRPTSPAR